MVPGKLKNYDGKDLSVVETGNNFADWLKAEGYKDATCKTQLSQVRRLQKAFGDLEAAERRDGCAALLAQLAYSRDDEIQNRPNPSPIEIHGESTRRGLEHLRGALVRYQKFLRKSLEGVSWPELQAMRGIFLERCPDFEHFEQTEGTYFHTEREYKDNLLNQASTMMVSASVDRPEELGSKFLELMSPGKSNFIGWRTFAVIQADPDTHTVVERELGRMILSARDELVPSAVARCAQIVEPLLRKAAKGAAVFGGVRSLLTCAMAFAYPDRAIDVKTRFMQRAARSLLGHGIFKPAAVTAEEYSGFLDLAERVKAAMTEWGWMPRDLWDVQGFLWVVTDETWKPNQSSTTAATADQEEEDEYIMNDETQHALNTILFGPPGTGKTWTTSRRAVEICNNGIAPADPQALREAYKQLVATNRIAFTTFHQSIGYEEFVEGLRPETGSEDGPSSAGFRLVPKKGIFREICAQAEAANKRGRKAIAFDFSGRSFYKMSLGKAWTESHIYDAAIEGKYVVLGWGGDLDWSDPRYEKWEEIRDRWHAEVDPNASGNSGNIAQLWRFRTMKQGDIVIVSEGTLRFRAIAEVTSDYQFVPNGEGGNHRRSVKWLAHLDESLPIEMIYDGKLAQASCYPLVTNKVRFEALREQISSDGPSIDPPKPEAFVLIIDEINRANVSKVFGELITLLEADKRLGAENEVIVTLPYSNQPFGVPGNLYVLGTMNTADRSIAPLDTALRRRFEFVEMMPDYASLQDRQVEDIHLGSLLQSINHRIEWLYDRDHLLGQADFLKVKDKTALDKVMRNKIVPLLAEYFHDDWARVRAALNDRDGHFVRMEKLSAPPLLQGEDRYSYTLMTGDVPLEAYAAALESK